MDEVMQGMWHQLGVENLHTSVFHPQTNGLVERFSKTLKSMLRRFTIKDPTRWSQLLAPFWSQRGASSIHWVFPFEQLFGSRLQGILDLDREQWERNKHKGENVAGIDLGSLKEKLQNLASWAQENLRMAQQYQKNKQDKNVQPREFQPGEEVLLLLPTSEIKLWAKWKGPYKVIKTVSPVDHVINTPDQRVESKIYHVNHLKNGNRDLMGQELGPSRDETLQHPGVIQNEEGRMPHQQWGLKK